MMERPDKLVSECSVRELLSHLGSRCPALVVACCIPDDNNETQTITLLSGHRATVLGLTELAKVRAMASLLQFAAGCEGPLENDE